MLTVQKVNVSEDTMTRYVNIPQEFDFNAEEVFVNKIGDVLMITPVSRLAKTLERGAEILALYAGDFMEGGLPESIPVVREEL